MASMQKKMQYIIREYRKSTGKRQVDMHDVARFAVSRGWPLPKPKDPFDLLARSFTRAARQEVKPDSATGKPYRANHAVMVGKDGQHRWVWVDIDEAERSIIYKSLQHRREQMVDDGYQLTLDAEHWNRINPNEKPIQLEMDMTLDIEWRKNAPEVHAA